MISFKEYLAEESTFKITTGQLKELEKTLDKLFAEINVDIEFSRHFFDRLNDARNKDQIRISELRDLFRAEFKKYKNAFANMKDDYEAMFKSIQSKINIPFVININKDKEIELTAKTIMRKPNFTTRTKVYKV